MSVAKQIRHLTRSEIDIEKWNACIEAAPNGLIYSYSWYLDAFCDHWDGFVLDDYVAVMPVPWRRKWGIKYVYQAPFIQRLGIFSKNQSPLMDTSFFQLLYTKFLFINLDSEQRFVHDKAAVTNRKNLLIDLNQPYKNIVQNFTTEAAKNLRKAEQRGCKLVEGIPVSTIISLYRKAYGALQPNIGRNEYDKLTAFGNFLIEQERAFTYGVVNATNELVYGSLILSDKKRIYYLMGAPTKEGRNIRATYFFLNQMFQIHAETPLIFDFEGSDIPAVSAFYRRFGPREEQYYNIKINRLPQWVNWFKNLRQ